MKRQEAQEHCKALDLNFDALEKALELPVELLRSRLVNILGCVESPIERKLLLALLVTEETAVSQPEVFEVVHWAGVSGRLDPPARYRLQFGEFDWFFATIELQAAVGCYFCDIKVTWTMELSGKTVSATVCIEADGHNFHERTKEQARHDRKRDRFFTAQGLKLLRFTGSEIHRDPAACAREVFALLDADLKRQSGVRP